MSDLEYGINVDPKICHYVSHGNFDLIRIDYSIEEKNIPRSPQLKKIYVRRKKKLVEPSDHIKSDLDPGFLEGQLQAYSRGMESGFAVAFNPGHKL